MLGEWLLLACGLIGTWPLTIIYLVLCTSMYMYAVIGTVFQLVVVVLIAIVMLYTVMYM